MNRRTLKKHCKRAMETLIAKHGYSRASFSRATGDETVDAPCGMERRYVRNDFLEPGPLNGTMLLWESYVAGDGDWNLPIVVLQEIEVWEEITPEDVKRLLDNDLSSIGDDLAASDV